MPAIWRVIFSKPEAALISSRASVRNPQQDEGREDKPESTAHKQRPDQRPLLGLRTHAGKPIGGRRRQEKAQHQEEAGIALVGPFPDQRRNSPSQHHPWQHDDGCL